MFSYEFFICIKAIIMRRRKHAVDLMFTEAEHAAQVQ